MSTTAGQTTAENLYRFPVQYTAGLGYPIDPLWYDGNSANPPWYPAPAAPFPAQKPQKPAGTGTTGDSSGSQDGTIELKVPFCCDGAVRKVTKKLNELDGVGSVNCDRMNNKVTVKGSIKREKVLKQLKTIKHLQRADFWETKKSKN